MTEVTEIIKKEIFARFVHKLHDQLQSPNASHRDWKSSQVSQFIEYVGFPQYKNQFIENDVNGRSLATLNLSALKNELKIHSYGHR